MERTEQQPRLSLPNIVECGVKSATACVFNQHTLRIYSGRKSSRSQSDYWVAILASKSIGLFIVYLLSTKHDVRLGKK